MSAQGSTARSVESAPRVASRSQPAVRPTATNAPDAAPSQNLWRAAQLPKATRWGVSKIVVEDVFIMCSSCDLEIRERQPKRALGVCCLIAARCGLRMDGRSRLGWHARSRRRTTGDRLPIRCCGGLSDQKTTVADRQRRRNGPEQAGGRLNGWRCSEGARRGTKKANAPQACGVREGLEFVNERDVAAGTHLHCAQTWQCRINLCAVCVRRLHVGH